uniref:Uncharacterized protein n=1 Tax=Anguilla anguilla TaxID=7936 RepID=A0A0E9VNW5_ANGAN
MCVSITITYQRSIVILFPSKHSQKGQCTSRLKCNLSNICNRAVMLTNSSLQYNSLYGV